MGFNSGFKGLIITDVSGDTLYNFGYMIWYIYLLQLGFHMVAVFRKLVQK